MEDDWQNASTVVDKKKKKKKVRRVYVGNLRMRDDLEDSIRGLLSKSAIPIINNTMEDADGGIQILPAAGSKNSNNQSCFAMINCGDKGPYAVTCLNGMDFDGRILKVQLENTNKNNIKNRNNNKFGSSSWSQPKQQRQKPKQSFSRNTTNILENVDASNPKDTTAIASTNVKPSSSRKKVELLDFHNRCKMSLTDLMEEFGKEDKDWNKDPAFNSTTKKKQSQTQSYSDDNENSMLSPNDGKNPIHVELISFGFKYGIPKEANVGWSYYYPLAPSDCRDLPRAPHHVARLSGLSHQCKRVLLNMSSQANNDNDDDDDGDYEEEDENNVTKKRGNSSIKERSEEIVNDIWSALVEAIEVGGHGHANPLRMNIFVGSEYGRHRSVVLVEYLAQLLRTRLRKNDNANGRNPIIYQPVSVGTKHRDIDQNHRDDEAYGKDLKREHERLQKQKKRQERLEEEEQTYTKGKSNDFIW